MSSTTDALMVSITAELRRRSHCQRHRGTRQGDRHGDSHSDGDDDLHAHGERERTKKEVTSDTVDVEGHRSRVNRMRQLLLLSPRLVESPTVSRGR